MPKPLPPLPLSSADLENLKASGLTPQTIRENGLRTEHNSKLVARHLKRSPKNWRTGGLVIPYRNLAGEVNCYCRIRPHIPRIGDKGKRIKYESPIGSDNRAYFPAGSLGKIRDGKSPLFPTEGEKKSLALSQLGLAAIGLGGVDSWGKDGELIPDLAEIEWQDRDVYLIFDFDPKPETRHNVRSAGTRLAKALKAQGAKEVYWVELPPGPNGEKCGVDDFLTANPPEEFFNLVEQAQPVDTGSDGNTVIKIIPVVPPELDAPAYLGFVGKFIKAVAPHTEATDAGILAHLLPAVGTIIGPGPRIFAGTNHYARINTILAGRTNAGRKGTSLAPVDLLMERVDKKFWNRQRVAGLSSGEGLIVAVADKEEKDDDGNSITIPVEKRLFVIEEEFGNVLIQMRRKENILSGIIRSAFDNGNLATLTVNPRRATGAHISIVGHITPEELKERLDPVDMANGFGNRFLWFAVESDKIMPHTKPIPDKVFLPFVKRLKALKNYFADSKPHALSFDADANAIWEKLYPKLREDRPGLSGQMVARGSSMVLRIALVYALLDDEKSKVIKAIHLKAAQAVWAYCEVSAEQLFQSVTGDKLCDKLIDLIRSGPKTKDDFNTHLSVKQKSEVGQALAKLEKWNLIRKSTVKHSGAGRPATQWELF